MSMVCAGLFSAQERGPDAKIRAGTPGKERASFLVVLREQADLSGASAIQDPAERRRFVYEALWEVAERTQGPVLESLRASGARARAHYLVNMIEVDGDPSLWQESLRLPEVSHVAPNRRAEMRRPQIEAQALPGEEPKAFSTSAVGYNIGIIRAPQVWGRGFTGQGIVVANADTGFAWQHPALRPHYRGQPGFHDYSWHDAVHDAGAGNPCGSDSPAPCDDDGHGTATSGLSVGDDGLGNQIGVAPGARLIGCRNMDRRVGTPARYAECFEFFLAPTDAAGGSPRPELGADVINNSWGCRPSEGCTDPNILRSIVENVRAAGIFVAVSAGNEGNSCSTVSVAPAIYEGAFSIGATGSTDAIARFSSRGPVTVDGSNRLKPDLVAPGVATRTASPPDGFTASFSGTSAASPHVAGAVALLWSAVPELRGNVAATENALILSAVPLLSAQDCQPFPGSQTPNAVFGFGRLDIAGAIAIAAESERTVTPATVARPGTRVLPPDAEANRSKIRSSMAILSTREESPTLARLEIEVPSERVGQVFSEVTRAYAKRASIPGFRKGHAPESVVQKRFAGEIREDVLEALLPEALSAAVEEKSLSVLGHPRIEDLTWDPPGPIRFTARLDLKPAVEPGDWKGIPVEDVSVEPSDEEVAAVLDRLRDSHAEFHPIEGRAAAPGDFAVADIAGAFVEILAPGQNPRTFRDEKLTLEIGHPDSMPEINEALRGTLPGQTRKFRKTFPDDFPNDEFKGKTVDYELTLVALKEKRLPEATEEFAKAVGEGETVETLREKIRRSLRQEKEADRRRRFRRKILDTLLSRGEIPAPEVLVESETEGSLRDYARYLAAGGVDPKEADWEKLRREARPGAENRVREYLILDAIARREGVEVTDTELEAEFRRTAARRGVDPAALRDQLVQAGGLEALRDEMRLSKTIDLLISAARVLPSGEPVEAR